MLNKISQIMFIAVLAFFLVGSFSTSFAAPPPDKASKSQACQNASAEGKANASSKSALGDCTPSTPAPAPASEPPPEEPPGEDTDPCLDETYFWTHSECWV